MKTRRRHSLIVILMAVAVLFVASTTLASAKTDVKKVVYQGSGKVTVYFQEDVKYDDEVEVAVKDNSNTTYTATVKSKSAAKLQFKIKSFKAGKTYKATIKGMKSGSAVCSFKIYAKSKAVAIAKEKSKATATSNVKSSSDTYNGYAVWRITFNGSISGTDFKFTYLIKQQTGKVMYTKREQA